MSTRWRARTLDAQFADAEERMRLLTAPPVPVAEVPDPWDGSDFAVSWQADSGAPDIDNGTLVGRMVQIGRALFVRFAMVAGSGTAFGSGAWYFELPHGFVAEVGSACPVILDGRAFVGGDALVAQGRIDQGSPSRVYVVSQSNASPTLSPVDASTPASWGPGDSLELHGLVTLT